MKEDSINEWTEQEWNPVTGCTKYTSGCLHCYAETIALRFTDSDTTDRYRNGFAVTLHEEDLDLPYHWKKPRRVFVCSMSDLFHADIDFEFVMRIFRVMNENPQHLYMLLTKRAERMESLWRELPWHQNIWAGVTVEEARYNNRIDCLRRIESGGRFVVAEPLLGDLGEVNLSEIDFVFIGGESGPGARPMEPDWARRLIRQCEEQNVRKNLKQIGGEDRYAAGKTLDGMTWDDLPEPKVPPMGGLFAGLE